MNYTRELVATVNGVRRVMTGEMRQLMKRGIERNLIPKAAFKGPRLKLDPDSKAQIQALKNSIYRYKKQMLALENRRGEFGLTNAQIRDIEAEIEKLNFKIFESKAEIRDIKKACYKNQSSTIDFDA